MTEINVKNLSKEELKMRLEKLVRHERKVTATVLEHISEVERRRLYLDWDFSSMYEYLIRGLGYSEGAATRRLQAARALNQVPEIRSQIESGSLSLSQIARVQCVINHERKLNGPVSVETKKEIFAEILNKSAIQTDKILDRRFESPPTPAIERHKHDDSVELTVRIPKAVYDKMTRVKEVLSHSIPTGDWISIFDKMADDSLNKRDPLRRKAVVQSVKTMPSDTDAMVNRNVDTDTCADEANAAANFAKQGLAMNSSSEAIGQTLRPTVRRYVFQRDRVCQHKNRDGSICGSKFQLEVDHVHPRFAGGSNEIENLRLLCRVHNIDRYRRQK